MSLARFVSDVIEQVHFKPDFLGVPAVYERRIEDENGNLVRNLSVQLHCVEQTDISSLSKNDNVELSGRVSTILVRTRDLVLDGKKELPKAGDIITVDGKRQYSVGKALFCYEDAERRIMKITAFRVE